MSEEKYWQELSGEISTYVWILINRNIKSNDFLNDRSSWHTHCSRPTHRSRMQWRNFLHMPIFLEGRIDYHKVINLVGMLTNMHKKRKKKQAELCTTSICIIDHLSRSNGLAFGCGLNPRCGLPCSSLSCSPKLAPWPDNRLISADARWNERSL